MNILFFLLNFNYMNTKQENFIKQIKESGLVSIEDAWEFCNQLFYEL